VSPDPTKPPSTQRSGFERFNEDVALQLKLMGDRCPPYRRLLETLSEILSRPEGEAIAQRLAWSWDKRVFESAYERPLLILAALRYDALVEGEFHPLFEGIAAKEPQLRAISGDKLLAAMAHDRIGFWITLRTRRVQTNEVSRAIAWVWPAILAGCGDGKRPLGLVDIGASAGLNLIADRLRLVWQRRGGATIATPSTVDIRSRTGFDPRPLDVRRKEDCVWLEACIWPGEQARLKRLATAISAFQHASPSPKLELARASSVPSLLEATSQSVGGGGLVIAYQTLVHDYIPAPEREPYKRGMDAWLLAGEAGARAWATLELDDTSDAAFGCALDVRVSSGSRIEAVRLARTSYHPEVVDPVAGAEQRLTELLARS